MNRRAWKRSLRNQFNQQRKFAARQSWSTTTNPILRHLALWWESFLVGEYEFSSADRLKRLTTLSLVLVAALGAVSVRLYYLQSKDSLRWTSLATKQQEKRISVNEARGTIYDAAGRALAVSLPTVSLGANPNRIKSPEQKLLVAQKLAPIIALSDSALLGMLNSPKSFVWLVRDLPAGVADEVAALK